jgi:hypothetical protein
MSEEDILIDPESALVAGTFAVICGLLGALANGITMAVILKDKKIKSHCTTPGKSLKSIFLQILYLVFDIKQPILFSPIFSMNFSQLSS